jgi:hypothetical protein
MTTSCVLCTVLMLRATGVEKFRFADISGTQRLETVDEK